MKEASPNKMETVMVVHLEGTEGEVNRILAMLFGIIPLQKDIQGMSVISSPSGNLVNKFGSLDMVTMSPEYDIKEDKLTISISNKLNKQSSPRHSGNKT